MFWYINTFFIENVSTCRYKYILKVSDTYTVSDTKGLLYTVLFYLEQIMKHEMMIRFRMAPWQIDIFIHVEGLDVLETDFSGLEIFHKLGIHFQRSSSSWQTFKDEKLMNWISSMQKLKKFLPKTKYLSLLGLNSLMRLTTYLAAHSPTLISSSKMTSLIFNLKFGSFSLKPRI